MYKITRLFCTFAIEYLPDGFKVFRPDHVSEGVKRRFRVAVEIATTIGGESLAEYQHSIGGRGLQFPKLHYAKGVVFTREKRRITRLDTNSLI